MSRTPLVVDKLKSPDSSGRSSDGRVASLPALLETSGGFATGGIIGEAAGATTSTRPSNSKETAAADGKPSSSRQQQQQMHFSGEWEKIFYEPTDEGGDHGDAYTRGRGGGGGGGGGGRGGGGNVSCYHQYRSPVHRGPSKSPPTHLPITTTPTTVSVPHPYPTATSYHGANGNGNGASSSRRVVTTVPQKGSRAPRSTARGLWRAFNGSYRQHPQRYAYGEQQEGETEEEEDDKEKEKELGRGGKSREHSLDCSEAVTQSYCDTSLSIVPSPPDHFRARSVSGDPRMRTPSVTSVVLVGPRAGDVIAGTLQRCHSSVRRPYLFFLKLIGWQPVRLSTFNLEQPRYITAANVSWLVFVYLLLLASFAAQILTCFKRVTNTKYNVTVNNTTAVKCDNTTLVDFVVPDVLLLAAFTYGLFIFRCLETEHLFTLIDTAFLYSAKDGPHSERKLTRKLHLLMFCAALWIVFSVLANITRAVTIDHYYPDPKILWNIHTSNDEVFWSVMVSVSTLGFLVIDCASVAVVLGYSIQAQLITHMIDGFCQELLGHSWEIDEAIQHLMRIRNFLTKVNKHFARAVTILLFRFSTSTIGALYTMLNVERSDWPGIVSSVLSLVQWITISAFPILMASGVYMAYVGLRKTSLEMRARPLTYKTTSQLDLDSFIVFTSNLDMTAKLCCIPVTSAMFAGVTFVSLAVLYLLLDLDDSVNVINWL